MELTFLGGAGTVTGSKFLLRAAGRKIPPWLGHFRSPPRRTFITHGEPEASDALRRRIEETLGWPAAVPEHAERILLAR